MLVMAAYQIYWATQNPVTRRHIDKIAKQVEQTMEVAWLRQSAIELRPESNDFVVAIRKYLASYFVSVATTVDPDYMKVIYRSCNICPSALNEEDESYWTSKVFAFLMASTETKKEWEAAKADKEKDFRRIARNRRKRGDK